MLVFLLTIFFAGSASQDAFGFVLSSIRSNPAMRKESSYLHLTAVTESNNGNELLLPPSVFSTIEEGRIAVIPKFLPQNEIDLLRSDAQLLWDDHRFSTDALAGYGSAGKFDPEKDRAVLRLPQWKNDSLGNFSNRQRFGSLMGSVRSELAYNLNRPNLDNGYATTMYGKGSTEISYTRFGPGAFLKRHVDEHHEEIKGVDGWSKPTRRSISWLIYLNDVDWDSRKYGGQLRCFERKQRPFGRIGATPSGDLQIGWLASSVVDPYERPVYLDSKRHYHGDCAMYIFTGEGDSKMYISKTFDTNPIMYLAGSEALIKKLILSDRKDLADRFRLIEPPKSKISDILKGDKSYIGQGEIAGNEEELEDVEPRGGTLVLFDSVSLPHEVVATKSKERWACSGWFHEDQQKVV